MNISPHIKFHFYWICFVFVGIAFAMAWIDIWTSFYPGLPTRGIREEHTSRPPVWASIVYFVGPYVCTAFLIGFGWDHQYFWMIAAGYGILLGTNIFRDFVGVIE